MKKIAIIIFMVGLFCGFIKPQDYLEKQISGYTHPDELVTLSANLKFNQAIELLSAISEKRTGRKVVSLVEKNDPIGIEITSMQWEKALTIIVQYANLIYEKTPEVWIIKQKTEIKDDRTFDTYASVHEREIKISAVFFELDLEELKERGINWQFLLGKRNFEFGAGISTTSESATSSDGTVENRFGVETASEFSAGNFFGEALAFFKFLESEKLGEMISNPTITVRDKSQGRIQVGSDFSVKQRDFAGNVTDFFFSTGSIIEVTPYAYKEDGVDYVLLNLKVERSSGFPSELSTEIRKTTARTQVLMLDGEETVIGGLFSTEDKKDRVGIPFLKDLPWWVFGIRYLTGSDKVSTVKKELVILIKVELLPTLKERLATPDEESTIKKELNKQRQQLKIYQMESTPQ